MRDVVDCCEEALRAVAMDDLRELAATYPDGRSLSVDLQAVGDHDPDLVDDIVHDPDRLQETFEEAMQRLATVLDKDTALAAAHVRFENPPANETVTVGDQRSQHLYRLIGLEGQVTKRTEINPKLHVGVFECLRCGMEHRIPQGFGTIDEPSMCEECGPEGFLKLNKQRSEWVDHQVVRLQQPPEDAIDGSTDNIDIHLTDDLCGQVEGGQRATFAGEYRPVPNKGKTRHKKTVHGKGFTLEDGLDDVDVAEHADEIDELRSADNTFEQLCAALAPGHRGDWHVKEALVLQMFGGWARSSPDGNYHRGDSHIYLIGDPGVGKSNLLRAVGEIAPRVAMTDGTGSSAAGLTAAITKDDFGDEQWTIEAGTLVRANKGVAVVDELDKGDTADLEALHTALESQEVLVSKAGRHAHLPAKTSLLAAGNPLDGHFDPTKEFASQVDLQSPLLSRFDLIFTMRERVQEDKVNDVADHMVDTRQAAGKDARGEDLTEAELDAIQPDVEQDAITAYIAYARQHCRPVIRDQRIARQIKDYYTTLKMSLPNRYTSSDAPPLPVTARKVDAVQRLAEASARTEHRDEIIETDVERATRLTDRALADIGIEPGEDASLGRTPDSVDTGEVGL